jgi:hypothetical protein
MESKIQGGKFHRMVVPHQRGALTWNLGSRTGWFAATRPHRFYNQANMISRTCYEDRARGEKNAPKTSVTVIGGGTSRSLAVRTLHDRARGGRKVLFRILFLDNKRKVSNDPVHMRLITNLVLVHPTNTAVETS